MYNNRMCRFVWNTFLTATAHVSRLLMGTDCPCEPDRGKPAEVQL